jgi:hypothetical protein
MTTLSASRHPVAHDLIVVTNDAHSHGEGNVVYRWNEKHRVGTRTRGHAGEKPSMRAIREAIARVA